MSSWKERFLSTFGLLWLRVLMGLGIASHGYDKLFTGRMDRFTEGVAKLGFPAPDFFAWASALTEFIGGILIALGLGTRVAAFFVFINMSVAVFIRHAPDPFDVKEKALAYWTVAMAIVLMGPGFFSVDRLIFKRGKK